METQNIRRGLPIREEPSVLSFRHSSLCPSTGRQYTPPPARHTTPQLPRLLIKQYPAHMSSCVLHPYYTLKVPSPTKKEPLKQIRQPTIPTLREIMIDTLITQPNTQIPAPICIAIRIESFPACPISIAEEVHV